MTERTKHGGSLTEKQQETVAAMLEMDDRTENVERVIGDGRYVQADVTYGQFESVLVVSSLTSRGENLVSKLTDD